MSEATSPADPGAPDSLPFDEVVATKVIRALRRECAASRLRLRAAESELARLRGIEGAYRELTEALAARRARA